MATDKSINIRQVEATEKLAAALAMIEQQIAELKADVSAVKALLAGGKFQEANRQVSTRQGGK